MILGHRCERMDFPEGQWMPDWEHVEYRCICCTRPYGLQLSISHKEEVKMFVRGEIVKEKVDSGSESAIIISR